MARHGDNIIYGIHTVNALLSLHPERIHQLYVQKNRDDDRLNEIIAAAKDASVPVSPLDKEGLDKMVGDVLHQGVVALSQAPRMYTSGECWDLLDGLEQPPFLLILDQIQDPHNLGACIRTAAAANVHAVVVPKDRSVGLSPVVRKVASGAAEYLPLVCVGNLARFLEQLKERGVWLYGADAMGEKSLYETDLVGSIAVILGNEAEGLRRLTREKCDHMIAIPMGRAIASLNVSVAAGVILFEACRQRFL